MNSAFTISVTTIAKAGEPSQVIYAQSFETLDLKAFVAAVNSLPAPRKRRKLTVATLAE